MKSLPRKRSSLRLFSFGIVSLLGFGLAPTACSEQPEVGGDAPVTGCQSQTDCAEGQTCRPDGTCSDGACTSNEDCDGGQFCASWGSCESACASCGNACTVTNECPVGQYCSAGKCQQECQPGTQDPICGTSLVCDDDGKCSPRDDIVVGTGGSTPGEGGMGGGNDCIEVEVEFEPQIPNVVLLIDQSGSMNDISGQQNPDEFGQEVLRRIGLDPSDPEYYAPWDCSEDTDDSGNEDWSWRWNVVRNVLFHPDNGVVKPLENAVRFGYASYTNRGDTCPDLEEVAIGFGNHAAMLAEHVCNDVPSAGDTPTRESLTQVAEQFALVELDGPKIIVLATDGLPDNCTCNNWSQSGECANSGCDDDERVDRDGTMLCPEQAEQYDVVIEAQRIHEELGIAIEVINVSNPNNAILAAHLDDVAERGGAVSGASIDGFDPAALTTAFQTIIDGVRSCAIDLDGSITAGKEDTGVVTLDGVELAYNGPDGWVVNSPTQIELVGQACETIKSGDHDLDITFPCNAFVPVAVR